MNELAELASKSGLSKCAQAIESAADPLPPPAAADRALAAGVPSDPVAAIASMTRRGLDPAALAVARRVLGPVERGLLAWDALNGALLTDDALVRDLQKDAAVVRKLLPKPGHAFPLILPDEIERLVAGVALPALQSLDERGRMDAIGRQALGALRLDGNASEKQLELARQSARALHRSHLSSLAAVRLADLFFHHRYRRAIVDLVEVLLDQGAMSIAAWLGELTDPAPAEPTLPELLKYVAIRTAILDEDWDAALAHADQHRATFAGMPRERAIATTPRLALAYADASIRSGRETFPFDHIAGITSLESPWRYAFRVMTTYAAKSTRKNDFVQVMQRFLEQFGNEFRAWYDCVSVSPDDAQWGPGFYALAHREAVSLPHDAAVWRVLPLMLGGDGAEAAYDEIEARLSRQATLS
ncbi:MAG TPA: hypothetical protein VGL86_06355 [Polyangia bacterium]|jgi:hypothetical protein